MGAYDLFAAVYDRWSADMTEDVAFYCDLARGADGPVVELAVGTGRVAVPVAQAIGRQVTGVDSSPAMLAQARKRAAAAGVDLDLREGDMRNLVLDEPAALVYCPFRSLLHLPTWADRRRVFERVARSLRPGGRFAWNAFVFDPAIAAEIGGTWREQNGIRHLVEYDFADCRVDVTLETGGLISLWWVARSEFEGLVDVAGLDVEGLYGDFGRSPFGAESREQVWVARKAT